MSVIYAVDILLERQNVHCFIRSHFEVMSSGVRRYDMIHLLHYTLQYCRVFNFMVQTVQCSSCCNCRFIATIRQVYFVLS